MAQQEEDSPQGDLCAQQQHSGDGVDGILPGFIDAIWGQSSKSWTVPSSLGADSANLVCMPYFA